MMRRGMQILLAVLMVLALATVVHADGGATTNNNCNIVWLCPG